ncbi:hypothetical protein PG997_012663 [Apiospora hydei]|uniref:F-box domain-containing protein n=1 Tax=Apiospora hydei TaxID=1337664 RepID=A0ABR1V6G7_9PEZI
MALSRIEQLSPELKQLVLSYATDWPSLRSAVLSCPEFYAAFKSAEQWIATRFVKNLIDIDVLPEAYLAQGLRNLTVVWPYPEAAHTIETWLAVELRKKRRVTDEKLTVRDAIAMSRLHHAVESFVDEYIRYCTPLARGSTVPQPVTTLAEKPLTRAERSRMSRAFYLLEMFSRLHRCGAPCAQQGLKFPVDIPVTHPFFAALPPWEKEQLRCINWCLKAFYERECVQPLFPQQTYFADTWNMAQEKKDLWYAIQDRDLTRLGLEALHEASISPDSARREEIMLQGRTAYELRREDFPPQLDRILDNLERIPEWDMPGKPDGLEVYVRGASLRGEDADPGPRAVWTWVNEGTGWGRYDPHLRGSLGDRQRETIQVVRWTGLVFWDHSRLEAAGVFSRDSRSWVTSAVSFIDLGRRTGE